MIPKKSCVCWDWHTCCREVSSLTQTLGLWRCCLPDRGGQGGSCAYEMCGSAPGMPAAKRENAKTRKRENQTRKRENAKTGKRENAQIEHVPRSTWNTNVITALGMCKVCTEAVHSVALGTRTLSQLWACVKYVPKQSIP